MEGKNDKDLKEMWETVTKTLDNNKSLRDTI